MNRHFKAMPSFFCRTWHTQPAGTKPARWRFITSILSLLLFFSASAQTLVWQENFDSTSLNGKRWTYDFGDGSERAAGYGWGNSEMEYYTSRPQNVRTDSGKLIIEARREQFFNSPFTSGRIKTEGRVHFKYGTVEARIKLPSVEKGLWPAFWTLGTVGPSWPGIGEIDMMEVGSAGALAANLGNKQVSSAAHWSNATGGHEYNVSHIDAAVDLSLDYHLFKTVWTSQYIKMYLDGVEYYSFDISGGAAANLSEFHTPHFLLLNLAVGGQYTGIFNAAGITAALPGKMMVDYIRLYQNPGDELYLGDDHGASGNFGVLTETTPVADSLTYGTNATLYYWNNLSNIPNAVPYEGNRLWAVHANAGDWFGMGIDNNYVNLNNFATGSLKFHFKSSYTGQYKIGLKTGHGETWINFAAGVQKYGLLRDGQWHEVTIPLADFNNPAQGMNIDLYSVKAAFMFAGDPAGAAADFYFDNMYYTGGIATNPAPSVGITSPTGNSIFTSPANITITADAADVNGTVSQVDFYNGTTLLGSDATAPYSFTWNNPRVGVDTLIAKATDNLGATTTSASVLVFVSAAGNLAPSASITTPVNNAAFLSPASVSITTNVADGDNGIYKVEFYNGTTLLSTSTSSPYSYTWTGVAAGSYALTIKATDNGGLATTSSVVNVTVSNPVVPTVSITSPATNASFTPPANIAITANAADANGNITKVEFYNGATMLGEDLTSPYGFTWSNVSSGNYSLTAKATDNDGNTTTSAVVAITVAPAACTGLAVSGDYSYEVYSAAGTVYYKFRPLAPIAGSNAAIIYTREGTGSGGFAGYNMVASGSDFTFSKAIGNGTLTTFYFSYNVPAGGERNSSANPHAYVAGTVCVAGAPNATITSPVEAASFTSPANITINAVATDLDGTVAKVEFYNGATLLGEDLSSPYSFTWSNVAAGAYALTAKATDNAGLQASSIPVNILVSVPNANGYCGTAVGGDYEYKAETVGGNVTFTLHPLSPIAGCSYALIYVREGTTGGYPGYNTTAAGTDFIFTKAIASGTPVSYYFTYQTPPAGERNSSANPHSYTVGSNCTGSTGAAPTVAITSPANNASYTEPANITLTANAADADGTVSKVEFFRGATLIGSATSSPYTFTWTNAPAGNYTITAKATDNTGLTAISATVLVKVNIDNSTGFCGMDALGDYNYKMESAGGNVVFTFHPLTPIAGCAYALIYVREGLSGGYPGYSMTAIGSDFRFTKAIADSTPLSVYFTYNVPSGGERNSAAAPHSYKVGTVCLSSLPVTLLDFTASLQNNGTVAINWSTATEQNSQYFLLERSSDGRSFTTLFNLASAGNSITRKSYSVTDIQPLSGNNYYRLTQVDRDGRATVYGIKQVSINGKGGAIQLYPNPLKGSLVHLVLPGIAAQKMHVEISDLAGKIIYATDILPQANTLELKLLQKPAAGVYLVKVPGYTPVRLLVN